MKEFHLSVVATTRNDNHGGTLTYRMQHFIDGFVAQCRKHQLHAELILVEWNPPEDKPSLAAELRFPKEQGPCAIRIITVPAEIHATLDHSEKIPLFQMIGKNVGIQRALGKFVLATNIDIIFSDEIITFMRDQLKPKTLYRVDRLDIPALLPEIKDFDEILHFCKEHFFRINGKYGTFNRATKGELFFSLLKKVLRKSLKFYKIHKLFKQKLIFKRFHTNACGDFTLLSLNDWNQLRGYPEWNIFSWHVDSVLLHQAYRNQMKEKDLKQCIYHIDHSSGYSPEGAKALFKRLQEKQIPYLTDDDFSRVVNEKQAIYNGPDWGLSKYKLKEEWV